jgi:hypothetical protein
MNHLFYPVLLELKIFISDPPSGTSQSSVVSHWANGNQVMAIEYLQAFQKQRQHPETSDQ